MLPLLVWDLRVTGIYSVGQAGEFDTIGDEDALPPVNAVQKRHDARVEVVAIRDDRLIWRLQVVWGKSDQAG